MVAMNKALSNELACLHRATVSTKKSLKHKSPMMRQFAAITLSELEFLRRNAIVTGLGCNSGIVFKIVML